VSFCSSCGSPFVCSCQAAAGGGACSSDFLSRTRKNHSIRELGGHIAHASWFSAAHGASASSCRYGVAGQGLDSLAQRKTLLKGGTGFCPFVGQFMS